MRHRISMRVCPSVRPSVRPSVVWFFYTETWWTWLRCHDMIGSKTVPRLLNSNLQTTVNIPSKKPAANNPQSNLANISLQLYLRHFLETHLCSNKLVWFHPWRLKNISHLWPEAHFLGEFKYLRIAYLSKSCVVNLSDALWILTMPHTRRDSVCPFGFACRFSRGKY